MLSSVLNSDRAIEVNIAIMRAFVRLREILATHKDIARKLDDLEKKLGDHDEKFLIVFEAIRQLMLPPPEPQKKRPFGCHPYDAKIETLAPSQLPRILTFLWPYRTILWDRKIFGGQTYRQAGKPWYEYGQIPVERMKIHPSIAFAFVATHNHFVLDRGGIVFN